MVVNYKQSVDLLFFMDQNWSTSKILYRVNIEQSKVGAAIEPAVHVQYFVFSILINIVDDTL